MTLQRRFYAAAGFLAALSITNAVPAQSRPGLNINFPNNAERCSEVKASSAGAIARSQETFTISKSEASVLAVSGVNHGNIRARGWERTEYSIEACRIAVSTDQAGAERLLKSISVTRTGARLSSEGPDNGQWVTIFFVNAPANAALDLETRNGPVSVRSVTGNLKVRVQNGPISLQDCSGTIDAQSANGPIKLSGGSGDVTLNAANGPISVRLSGDEWSGPKLVARTTNGPLSATLPHTFRSGIQLESTGRGPVSCRLDACAGASVGHTGDRRVLELNGSSPRISLSTGNGPISLAAPRGSARLI